MAGIRGNRGRAALEGGVLFTLGTDAHSVSELRFMRWGVDQARRGWAQRMDVANTRSLESLLRLLAHRAPDGHVANDLPKLLDAPRRGKAVPVHGLGKSPDVAGKRGPLP